MELREYLWKERLTQKDMATMLGFSIHGFNKIVNRRTSPSLGTAIMIVEFTDNKVSFHELLSEKDIRNFKDKKK